MKKPAYRVTIDLRKPETHRALVRLDKLTQDLPSLLQFPVWTPGSYMVREYSRHITNLSHSEKIAKNKWRLLDNPAHITYEVYGFEKTVRTSYIDKNYFVLVGAATLPLLFDCFELHLLTPTNWTNMGSALPFHKAGNGHWKAIVDNDDQWIDCPIVASAPEYGGSLNFRAKGIPHSIHWVGNDLSVSAKKLAESFKKIADTTIPFFGGAPFKKYSFLLHFSQKAYGGLEHRDSQLSQFDGSYLHEKSDWDRFQRLIAHEYFHAWNVKSIRPKALGPFNYQEENYTQDLWFAEGITDYFDDWIPYMAGFISEEALWKAYAKDAQTMADGLPNHSRRSVADSSFDAWIRAYRADEDSLNTDVSYYSKGALLGLCWDAHLRSHSRGKWTLALLMRAIWKEFGVDAKEDLKLAKAGFERAQLLEFCEKKTGVLQKRIVESWVTARKPLPWKEALKVFGVEIETSPNDAFFLRTGCMLNWQGTRALIGKVLSGSAAEEAGLAVGDEFLGLDGLRFPESDRFVGCWKRFQNSREIQVTFARGERLLSTKLHPRDHAGIGLDLVVKLPKAKKHK